MSNLKTIQLSTSTKTQLLGLIGLIGAGIFFFAVTVLHILRSDINPIYDFVSNYANGPYGWLFSLSIFIHGITNIGIAIGLNIATRGSILARRGVTLFIISSLAVLLATIFPIDSVDFPRTIRGNIHFLAANIGFLAELGALAFIGVGLFTEPGWNKYARLTLIFAFFAVGGLTWLFADTFLNGYLPGLAERVVLGSFLAWEIVSAYLLIQNKTYSQQS